MNASTLVWAITVAGIAALLAYDFFFHVRAAHVPTIGEASRWSALYVGIAVAFGLGMYVFAGGAAGTEYFAGYITEKALSVDNLFVYLVIIASFRVPREDQQKVLLFGIVFALVARTSLIFIGSALIDAFSWVFYIFGLILLITSGKMLKPAATDEAETENVTIRLARWLLPTSDTFDGDKLTTVRNGKRVLTPMLLVMVAIGGTDVLFALDSVPAIFGLTDSVYIVFTATAFSLLGLRQLYFLIEGLLDRLIYLSYGLAAILALIGIKLVLHALHENNLTFINDAAPVPVVEISTGVSLLVIVSVLAVTVLMSLFSRRGKAGTAIANARRHATSYLDLGYTSDWRERQRVYDLLCREEHVISALPEQYRAMIDDEHDFRELLARAHATRSKNIERALQDPDTEPEHRAAIDHMTPDSEPPHFPPDVERQ
ncbi:MAG: transporter [Thermoleophilia bacterium]|nr:transporter [Thermoleophilia bacterium]